MSVRTARAFSSVEVCAATGWTYRQLDFALRTGRLELDEAFVGGSGHARRFSETDLLAVCVMARLRRFVGLDTAADAGRMVREAPDVSELRVTTSDPAVEISVDMRELRAELAERAHIMV